MRDVVEAIEARDEPCYAARLAWPFLRVLQRERRLAPGAAKWLEELDGDHRVPIRVVHQMLENAENTGRDPALGLKAAREFGPGDGGALDYAISSADSVRAAVSVIARYARLLNDTLHVTLQEQRERAVVRVENPIPMPRSALDFQLCSILLNHWRAWPQPMLVDLDVWFPYREPPQLSEHRATLVGARLHFNASFSGFGFDKALLDAPLRTSDRSLHKIVSRHAEQELLALPRKKSLSERVRELLISELPSGNANAVRIARKLEISRRTLNRHLEQENTSFRVLLDEVRRQLALRYLATRDLSIPDIALLTGFSEAAAFHRAFRRWTDQTPSEYRRTQRAR
jgi:AraC-like DNA-binding protein